MIYPLAPRVRIQPIVPLGRGLAVIAAALVAWTGTSARAQFEAVPEASSPIVTMAPASVGKSTTAASFWGTGFMVGDGYIITAYHVVKDKAGLLVGPNASNRWVSAELIQSDAALDLALLKARISGPSLSLASSANLPTGLEISVIGYPQPRIQGMGKKITNGLINGYRNEAQNVQDVGMFQFSAEVAKGNSGGPVFAPDGTVIGMVQRKIDAKKVAEQTEDVLVNVNYALRSSQIIKFLQSTVVNPSVQTLSLSTTLRPFQLFEQAQSSVVAVLGRGRTEPGTGTDTPAPDTASK